VYRTSCNVNYLSCQQRLSRLSAAQSLGCTER